MRLELMQPVFRQDDGRDLEGIIGLEVDSIESAESGSDLILRPDILLDDVLLHVDRLRGKFVFRNVLPPQGRQRMNQSDRKRRTGAQPGPRRQVAVMMDFAPLIVAPGPPENGANGRMLDLVNPLHILNNRIHNAVLMLKKRREISTANMAILIDRGRQHDPAMLLIPGGIVCTATEKRNAERGPGDDHLGTPSPYCLFMKLLPL